MLQQVSRLGQQRLFCQATQPVRSPLGCLLASRYGEGVVDRLFDDRTQRRKALQPSVQAIEQTLKLDEDKQAPTPVRMDNGYR